MLAVRRQRIGAPANAPYRRPSHARLFGEMAGAVGGQFPRHFEKAARLVIRPRADGELGDDRRVAQFLEPTVRSVEPIMDLPAEIAQFFLNVRQPAEVVILLDPGGEPRPVRLGQRPPRAAV